MKKEIYKVDEFGFIVDNYIGFFDEKNILISPKGDFVTTSLPQPLKLYKPRWNGTEWEEGAESEYIEDIKNSNAKIPTLEERIQELEITILNLMEVL